MAESEDTEKTEEATPERRRRAREEGQFARSRDTGPLAATAAVLLVSAGLADHFAGAMRDFCLSCFGQPLLLGRGDFSLIARETTLMLIGVCLPVAVAAAIAAVAAGFLEAGFHPNFDLLGPKWERLEPIGKLTQMFSPKVGLVNTALALLRVVLVAVVAEAVMESEFPMLARLSRAPLGTGTWALLSVLMRLSVWSTLALGILAGVDYGWSWFRHEQSIKMSRQDLKEELQQQEGSPQVRARQRARAREMLRRGVRKAVREATVVVANPTHVAVALRYRAHEGAPLITAKGYDEVAQHIKQLARDFGVPVVENRPLARALAERGRLGRVIPVDLYVAVAELLAFVYRLKHRGGRRA